MVNFSFIAQFVSFMTNQVSQTMINTALFVLLLQIIYNRGVNHMAHGPKPARHKV